MPLKLFVDSTLTCTKGLQSFLFLIICYSTDSIVQHSSNHPTLKAQCIRQLRPHLWGIDSCFLLKTPLNSIFWDAIMSRVVQKYRTSCCWSDIGRYLHAERIKTYGSQLCELLYYVRTTPKIEPIHSRVTFRSKHVNNYTMELTDILK